MGELVEFYLDTEAPDQPDQYAGEFGEVLALYREMRPSVTVEIGARRGGTLYQWIRHARPGAQVIVIDLPGAAWGIPGSAPTHEWRSWAERFGVCLTVLLADSHAIDTGRRMRAVVPAIDWLFIDGDHSVNGTQLDFLMYGDMVRPGGVIVLHDILKDETDSKIGVWQFWGELKQHYRTREYISHEGQIGRGLGVVFK